VLKVIERALRSSARAVALAQAKIGKEPLTALERIRCLVCYARITRRGGGRKVGVNIQKENKGVKEGVVEGERGV
jgi:hypothetical protein